MHQIILIVLAATLSMAFTTSMFIFTSQNLHLKEREKYQHVFEKLNNLNDKNKELNNSAFSLSNWREEISFYGVIPNLPPKVSIDYGFNNTNNQYYFCLTKKNPDKISHLAASGLREGFPRIKNPDTGVFSNSSSSGYSSQSINVNNACGSTVDYTEEPLEFNNYQEPLSITFWVGGIEKFYKTEKNKLLQNFSLFKESFDQYVLINNTTPPVSYISNVFSLLRPYGKLPTNHKGFTWEYGMSGGSNYLCLKSNDTTSLSEIEREITLKKIYQLTDIMDPSYFSANTTSCDFGSQIENTNYANPVNVFGTYWLN